MKKFLFDLPFAKRVTLIALPLMVQQLISVAVNLVDNLMIGYLGDAAIASVAAVNKYYMIAFFAINGLAAAASVFIAQYHGAEEKDKIAAFIDAMPDADTALHGDMHFGNAVTNLPQGAPMSDKHDTFFIDLGAFAMGTPRMDLAMMALCCIHDDEAFIQENFHFSKAIAEKFWSYFADEYLFNDDNLAEKLFGKGKTLKDIENELIPYVGLKTFLIEKYSGIALPNFAQLVRDYILK